MGAPSDPSSEPLTAPSKRDPSTTTSAIFDPARFLDERLPQVSPDLMPSELSACIGAALSAEADATLVAAPVRRGCYFPYL